MPSTPEIAFDNIVAGLPRERWEDLVRRAMTALHAGIVIARVPRLKHATELLGAAVAELDALAKESGAPAFRPTGPSFLQEAMGDPGPSEPTISGAFLLERDARARVWVAWHQLAACVEGYVEQASKILPLPKRPPKRGSVSLHTNPIPAAGDFLAIALAELDWVRGRDAAQLAIFMHVDPPVKEAADLEARRQRWDDRLKAARRKLRSNPQVRSR